MLCGAAASAILFFIFCAFRSGHEMVLHLLNYPHKKICLQLIFRGSVPSADLGLSSLIVPQDTIATVKNRKIRHLTPGSPPIPAGNPVVSLSNLTVVTIVFSFVTQVPALLVQKLSVCHVIVALQLP